MPHTWIQPRGDNRSHPFEDNGRLVYALFRNVGIDIAAAEKDLRPLEGAWILPPRTGRSDEAAAQHDDAAVAGGVPHRELARQAGALRETHEDDSPPPDSAYDKTVHEIVERLERGGKPGLVLRHTGQEAVGVPGVVRCRRREICEVGSIERGHEREDALR